VTEAAVPIRLLGISGSLRRHSYCTAILRTLGQTIAESATLEIFDLSSIPPYNEDEEGERLPQAVLDLRQAVEKCDGVVLASPEFNHGMPGVLKNALDWASRPAYRSPFAGKPSLVLTASPAFTGGVRAQSQIAETLAAMLAHVVAVPQVVIASVHEKVADGRMTDPVSLQFLAVATDALANAIALRRLARPAIA
jgi:chromate reductase, NAD(P)H dehydrogenase (quinone)